MEKTKESFENGLVMNRDQINKFRENFDAIQNTFEVKGFNVGGFDVRTLNTQMLVLFSLLLDKKVIKLDDVSAKLDQLAATIEYK